MLDTLTQDIWLAWGIGLLIGFPLLMILFGEMLYRIEDTEKHEPSRSLLGNAQYFVFPSLVIYLLLTKVVGLEPENVAVRATATIFWISLIYLVLSVFNMFWLKKSAGDGWQSRVPTLVLNIARLFLVAFGVAFVTSLIWGVDLGQMLAALGVGSIVLGLALQDTLGALFAGITLISARQFQVGDWLKTGDVVGRVITVNWHSVSLETFEGDLLVIPNSVLASNTFCNYSRPKRVHMERVIIQFCEEHPPNMVRQALLEAARNTPSVLEEPAPQVILRELADDAGAFEAQIYFSDYADIDKVRDAYLTRAWYAAKRYGIVFPFEDHQLFHFSSTEMNLGKDDTVTPDTLLQKLMELDVFGLSREQIKKLLVDAETARFGSGERVIHSGDENGNIYVILSGSARRAVIDSKGNEHNLGSILPGEAFGIESALRHCDNMANVDAENDLQVVMLSLESVEKVLKENPRLAEDLEIDIDSRIAAIQRIHDQHKNHDTDRVVKLKELLKKSS